MQQINEQKALELLHCKESLKQPATGQPAALAVDNAAGITVRRPKNTHCSRATASFSRTYQFWVRAEYSPVTACSASRPTAVMVILILR